MRQLRISIGNASCRGFSGRDPELLKICSLVKEKIQYLKSLKKHQLERWQHEETIEIDVGIQMAVLTVFKDKISEQRDLIVVQAFYPTWKFPNYFSFGRVGRIFAEGFFVEVNDFIQDAEDRDLSSYR